ncbi:MAG TPA: type II secretion system protein [Thermoanaerobaculia bacterium]|jgi:general secretion pathway protein G
MNETPEVMTSERPGPAVRRSPFRVRRSNASGFTLIELIVVVTIIGILAGVAIVNVRFAQRKAREGALKDNLFQMRKAIDNYYADKQRYPANLEELVPNYIRRIPPDPITQEKNWEEVIDDPMQAGGADAIPAETDPEAMTTPGVVDVKSTAEGTTLDNVPYSEL